MRLTERFVTTVTYVFSYFSFSDVNSYGGQQQAPILDISHGVPVAGPGRGHHGPIFKPPSGRPVDLPGGDLVCDYSRMGADWEPCSEPGNRACWLKNKRSGFQYNITTDYEDPKLLPTGIHRFYTLDAADGWINADGMNFTEGKFFWNVSDPASREPENRYPGPWVQACWGDTIHVNVRNSMRFNGTTIHWHGIRQLNTTEADGVPGISQCPIAPGDNFTYSFVARQYGSSWYHSHYSLQYADGALGPLTIHGPSSDDWDEPKSPILMTDWGHNSAFQAIWPNVGLINQSTLLNGRGNVTRYNNTVLNTTTVPEPHSISLTSARSGSRPKRYLLRLINTSFESFFIFSIDNHNLTIISTDFVSIEPYNTSSVSIGIGQRYNAIIVAQPINLPTKTVPKVFWMRAWRPKCFLANTAESEGYEKAGLVFYDGAQGRPDPAITSAWKVDNTSCADEPYDKLHPKLKWQVGQSPAKEETDLAVQVRPDPDTFPLALFSIGGEEFNPLAIDYSNPILLRLKYDGVWNPRWVVYPENYTSTSWVYLVVRGNHATGATTGAHPIHLHGHDFAILEQSNKTYDPSTVNLKFSNPPRRDVVLLPVNGYAIIAFPTDNPGSWIMHCHIAQHASFGLALQVLERQSSAYDNANRAGVLTQAQRTCNKWNAWWGECKNWWYDTNPGSGQFPGYYCDAGVDAFTPDSGI